jgi:hypothetical protein
MRKIGLRQSQVYAILIQIMRHVTRYRVGDVLQGLILMKMGAAFLMGNVLMDTVDLMMTKLVDVTQKET